MFLSCIDISKIVLIVYTSLMILHRTKIESLIIPTQQQMNKTFNPLSHREANTEILSVSEQGNKWKDTLLICGAPRGRTAPLPRILQRCCNPWSRDHTHTHTHARGSALSTTVWDTREQCALRLESFQHHCVFVLMITAEWSLQGVTGIAVCACVVVSSWSLRGRRKMCSLLTTVCEEEIWRILTLCFSVCVYVSVSVCVWVCY